MNGQFGYKIEPLTKNNYDTWRMQMEALLTKTDAWGYVCGTIPKPEKGRGDSNTDLQRWIELDRKARADLIICISPSELRHIKGCQTSKEVWDILESIYQSGGARKATLLKQLILQKMAEGSDVRDHLKNFFAAVDKLADMGVPIHDDLLAILLLYSLPKSFDNFRCAIESRDELPSPEALRVKILEENDARKTSETNSVAFTPITYLKINKYSATIISPFPM